MKIRKNTAAAMLAIGLAASCAFSGCTPAKGGTGEVSPGDAVSSQQEVEPVDVSEAVEIQINGEKINDVWLLQYNWYGEEFVSEDSLNKIMMTTYSPEGSHAPAASEGDTVSFVMAASEQNPSEVRLTQYGNTIRLNTGRPYDTLEPELANDGGSTYSFCIEFRKLKMYYYVLDCKWANGNSVQCAFAVELAN